MKMNLFNNDSASYMYTHYTHTHTCTPCIIPSMCFASLAQSHAGHGCLTVYKQRVGFSSWSLGVGREAVITHTEEGEGMNNKHMCYMHRTHSYSYWHGLFSSTYYPYTSSSSFATTCYLVFREGPKCRLSADSLAIVARVARFFLSLQESWVASMSDAVTPYMFRCHTHKLSIYQLTF